MIQDPIAVIKTARPVNGYVSVNGVDRHVYLIKGNPCASCVVYRAQRRGQRERMATGEQVTGGEFGIVYCSAANDHVNARTRDTETNCGSFVKYEKQDGRAH